MAPGPEILVGVCVGAEGWAPVLQLGRLWWIQEGQTSVDLVMWQSQAGHRPPQGWVSQQGQGFPGRKQPVDRP